MFLAGGTQIHAQPLNRTRPVRLHGPPAAAAYFTLAADGTDALLMAADHGLHRELAWRIRDDLIRLGLVDPGPGVPIADGATASGGDLIVCIRNDHTVGRPIGAAA